MTLDDLVKVFEDACLEWDSAYDHAKPLTYSMKWFGMRAVTNAIRSQLYSAVELQTIDNIL
jgi:hypothetical protein